MIERLLLPQLQQQMTNGGKAVIVYGARQVGKTTLVRQLLGQLPFKTLVINADELRFAEILSSRDLRQLQGLVADYEAIFIDEAQRIPEIGINLKLLVDNLPKLRIIVTGSSSLDLASKIQEPLTGRAWIHHLYPIGTAELALQQTPFEINELLEQRLIYGSYPEIFSITSNRERSQYLQVLTSSYLYKDILELSGIKNALILRNLLRLLAFQVGQQVSLTELATQLQISRETVSHYIDLLEQSFVVFRLTGFSRNLRKEVTKQNKIYFWDLGVRNNIIDNLNPITLRADIGQLWENFVIAERLKLIDYEKANASLFFWRTYTGAEIDLVEERDGQLHTYEIKWGEGKSSLPASFKEAYPQTTFQTIRPSTALPFLTKIPPPTPVNGPITNDPISNL